MIFTLFLLTPSSPPNSTCLLPAAPADAHEVNEAHFASLVRRYGSVPAPSAADAARPRRPARVIHGSARVARRWGRLGLVCAGSGVVVLLVVLRRLLADPEDRTRVVLLTVNQREEHIQGRAELEALAAEHAHRLTLHMSLLEPPPAWSGLVGKGDEAMARLLLPPAPPPPGQPGPDMVLVCGEVLHQPVVGGFMSRWGGALQRVRRVGADGRRRKSKDQGPLGGLLRDIGLQAAEVFKI